MDDGSEGLSPFRGENLALWADTLELTDVGGVEFGTLEMRAIVDVPAGAELKWYYPVVETTDSRVEDLAPPPDAPPEAPPAVTQPAAQPARDAQDGPEDGAGRAPKRQRIEDHAPT